MTLANSETLAQPFWPVKSSETIIVGTPPDSMIHHKVTLSSSNRIILSYSNYSSNPYGVSQSRRVLSPGLLLKKFDYIREGLQDVVGLTQAQREAALRLLRYWAYYGNVYVKESQVTSKPGCSKATYWRTVRLLRDLNLVQVFNRYVIRPHAQISNLYRLDRLVLLLARYLAEHGVPFLEKWLQPYLAMSGSQFWAKTIWLQKPELAPLLLQQRGYSAFL